MVVRRNTLQRQVLLDELRKLTCHPSACDLYQIVREKLPKVSIATVYRNLELLVDEGKVLKLEYCGNEARYDGNPEPHCHVRCMKCNKVDDLHNIPAQHLNFDPKEFCDYQILGHRLEFYGVCPECNTSKGGTQ